MTPQEQYDDAMFDYTLGNYDQAIGKFTQMLSADASHFDAQCALSMCHYRQGNFALAIEEGKKAETMHPKEQLVHTNLSLFYMKSGDKKTAEHHGLQARIAGWRDNMAPPGSQPNESSDPELAMSQPKPPPVKLPSSLTNAPWKKKPTLGSSSGETPASSTLPKH